MDAQLPADVVKRLLSRDLSNLIKRVQSGGRLSRSDRAMLEAMAAGPEHSSVTSAKSYVELAEILGVSRQAIHSWRKMEGAPAASSNGTHDVVAWREFMRRRGLKGSVPTTDVESALKARKLLAEVMERDFRLKVKQGEYVKVEDVRTRWAYHVGQAVSLLRKRLENELPPVLSGLDAVGIQTEMAKAVDEFAELMHQGEG